MRRIVLVAVRAAAVGCSSENAPSTAPQPQKSALLGCWGEIEKPASCNPKPLLLIDGQRTSWDGATDLDPSQIETVDVIKGQAALRLYGADGRNGVVHITTRKALLKL